MLFDPSLLLPLYGELWKHHDQVRDICRHLFSRRFLPELRLLTFISTHSKILIIDIGELDCDEVQQSCFDLWVIVHTGQQIKQQMVDQRLRTLILEKLDLLVCIQVRATLTVTPLNFNPSGAKAVLNHTADLI